MQIPDPSRRFYPSLCITHDCNLDCVYCYQKHEANKKMSLETAKQCIDRVFAHVPKNLEFVELSFIGGEPLLEFELIKNIVEYTNRKNYSTPYIFFASTNGTLLTDDMKVWISANKEQLWLGLSLDGTKETHDHNRSNSFDQIDISFFRQNWPDQGVKMTLSEFSLRNLANDIKYIYSCGFSKIEGVNLYEGSFNWDKDEYIKLLIPQLTELVSFYVENDHLEPNQLMNKQIDLCETNKERMKFCGTGESAVFFDTDGKLYPCSFITPMTFMQNELDDIMKIDFTNVENFIDEECYKNCYIYSICSFCAGTNYLLNKTFKQRNKSKCRIQKLVMLFIADMKAKQIRKNPKIYDEEKLYYTIEAIKKIRSLYLNEFIIFENN
jgi:radical SAM protein with 4Fe4S-binding SPASM domain